MEILSLSLLFSPPTKPSEECRRGWEEEEEEASDFLFDLHFRRDGGGVERKVVVGCATDTVRTLLRRPPLAEIWAFVFRRSGHYDCRL